MYGLTCSAAPSCSGAEAVLSRRQNISDIGITSGLFRVLTLMAVSGQ